MIRFVLVGLVAAGIGLGAVLWLNSSRQVGRVNEPPSSAVESVEEVCTEPCTVNGGSGTCVLNTCVRAGGCTRDVDCSDGNECTVEWCSGEGRCEGHRRAGTCSLRSGGTGVCFAGLCEALVDNECATDDDCGPATGACVERACLEGRCRMGARDQGLACATEAGRSGTCEGGACVEAQLESRRIKFELPAEQVARIETDLEARMSTNLRYDLKVSMVALVGGGYNIVLHNRRPRTEVRGLCDPSFVAFELAGYTASTEWKSRHMHVWLRPYEEGWGAPTQGGRTALERGRANSVLGMFGVVDVRAFRTWLEKVFTPLDPRPAQRGGEPPSEAPLEALVRPTPVAAVEVPLGVVDAGRRGPSGPELLRQAWTAFGDGRTGEAARLSRAARKLGAVDNDLNELLAGTSGSEP